MKRKRVFLGVLVMLTIVSSIVCGCTPKAKTIWCDGLGGNKFQIQFSVANSSYNGDWASFSVKTRKPLRNI